jgi:uncharacterized protein (DUF58 family)
VRPTRRLLFLAALWLVLALAAAAWAPLDLAWRAGGAVLLAMVLADAWAVRRAELPEASRGVPTTLPLGAWTRVRLRLANPGKRPAPVEVFDHHPAEAEAQGLPRALVLPAGGWAEVEYQLRPRRRGDAAFGPIETLLRSPLGLWHRRLSLGEPQAVRVLPNFRPLVGYALLAVEDRLADLGIRLHARRGEGKEFRELREYRQGDSPRQIDWNATSRRQRLVTRDYQEERNQQMALVVDCGRRMRAQDGDLSHFDHVLNAALLLAYAAARHGDAVSLQTFSGEPRWVPPAKGKAATTAVLSAVYDLEASMEPPDYLAAATRLAARVRRRALVVLLTNLRDEDASELLPALALLRQRHLVLVASLRETVLSETLAAPPEGFREALLAGACRHYLEARQRAHDQVRGLGVLTVDVEPASLPIALVNRYLEIKRSGLL